MSEPTYIEIWKVSSNPNGNRLGIAYTKSKCPTLDHLIAFRNSMAEMHDCKLEYLIRTDVIKHCPKCNRIMIDERVKSGRNWQIIWHCLCGHTEIENPKGESNEQSNNKSRCR